MEPAERQNQTIEDIFAEALQLPVGPAREDFVTAACAGNLGLRAEIAQLIAAHEAAGEFLSETPVLSTAPANQSAPTSDTPTIPGYRIDRLLGRGGIGSVYEAFDEKLHRRVALKILSTRNPEPARRRILAEARKAASLRDPAVVTIYSVLDEGPFPAINMELVEGFPLDRAAANLSFQQKARILQQVVRAIAVAHSAGVIHRDIKPENVLLTPALEPKVLDFGIAISLREANSQKNFEGTPGYASPEQVRGEPLTTASDIFSFGALMFKILTGRNAFEGASALEMMQAICAAEPPFPRDLAVGVPEDLQAICLACLAKNPADRPGADDVSVDLARYLAGEPARLRPALYGDLLRQKISQYSAQLDHWQRQGMISPDEKDRLETVHRRILADEDHWIIDARKISLAQTVLYTGAWLVVVSAALAVWLARDELKAPWPWLAPTLWTAWLLAAGTYAWRTRELMASASFLAGSVLSTLPTILTLLKETRLFAQYPPGVQQLLPNYSNAQILSAACCALILSSVAWRRLRMTAFAWTTATLTVLAYWAWLLLANWLGQKPEIMALWLTPLVAFEAAALFCERAGRVRWAFPFHLIALAALVATLDVIAINGPTLNMAGFNEALSPFLNPDRQSYLSLALNGYLLLALTLATERAKSLDLRRGSRVLEIFALLHMLGPLYLNASHQHGHPNVGIDVALYLATAFLLLILGPWRSSWRMLVGGLGGLAFGSYLLIDLGLVGRAGFTISIGLIGMATSAGMAWHLFKASRTPRK